MPKVSGTISSMRRSSSGGMKRRAIQRPTGRANVAQMRAQALASIASAPVKPSATVAPVTPAPPAPKEKDHGG